MRTEELLPNTYGNMMTLKAILAIDIEFDEAVKLKFSLLDIFKRQNVYRVT